MSSQTVDIHPTLRKLQLPALALGVVGLALTTVAYFVAADKPRFFLSYLYAYMAALAIPLGCLGLLMIQHLSGGKWGLITRRILEAGSRTIWIPLILFIPMLFAFFFARSPDGYHAMYHWMDHDPKYIDPTQSKNAFKLFWLQEHFMLIRTAICFAIWIGMVLMFNVWSKAHDIGESAATNKKFKTYAGPGVILWFTTVTFFVFDWIMSIDAHWYSTMYGFLFTAGQGLMAWLVVVFIMSFQAERAPLNKIVDGDAIHDLGKLLFAFNMFWAYLSFSQFLIMWSANLPEETPYYIVRMQNPQLKWVGAFLLLFHFAVPFTILLNRDLKRNLRNLRLAVVWLFLMRFVDLFWNIVPFQYHHPVAKEGVLATHLPTTILWFDFVTPFALVGIVIAAFIWQLGRRPLLPKYDPRLLELEHSSAHGLAHSHAH